MVKLVVIGVVIVAAVVGLAYFTQEGPSPHELTPAVAIDPPAGSDVLPDDMKAADVLRPIMAIRDQDASDQARADIAGTWTPLRGWSGGVKDVEVRRDSTWFSVEMFDSTILGQQFCLHVEVPGGLPQIKPGIAVTVRGRIKDVVPSPDPVLIPGRIVLDQATVIAPPPG